MLHSEDAIRRALVEGVAGDSSGMQKLRRFVSVQSTSLAPRDIDVINFIARSGSMGFGMVVLDVPQHEAFYTVQEVPSPSNELSLTEAFTEVLTRVGTKLPEAFRDEFMALLTPENLAIMVGALVLLAGAHIAGGIVGGVIDAVLIAVGIWFIGTQIFRVAALMVEAILKTIAVSGKDDPKLDQAAEAIADAIAIIGITTFLILMGKVAGKLAKKTGGKVKARLEAKKTARVDGKTKAGPKAVEEGVKPTPLKVDPVTQQIMKDYGLTPETKLYRVADPKYVDMQNMEVAGNPKSCAEVADHYNMVDNPWKARFTAEGEPFPEFLPEKVPTTTSASKVGPGLNVGLSDPSGYASDGMVKYSVKLGDVLQQGGKIYPDTGALAQGIKPLYVTFPGKVPITIE